jgi:small subunit ribosomal protein S8
MVNYQLGDFLIQIKNAAKAKKRDVIVETSKLKKAVALVLKKEGYLAEVTEKDGKLSVSLAFSHKQPTLIDLKLISKPGLRIYRSVDEVAKHKGGSILILSTPKGIVSSKQALKLGNGGEIISEIW